MKHHRVAQRILIRNHINPNCKWNMKILSGMKNYYSTEIFLLRQAGKVNIRELKKIIIKHFCNKLFQCSWNIEWALRNCRLPMMMRTETRMSWGRWQRRQRPYQLSQLTPQRRISESVYDIRDWGGWAAMSVGGRGLIRWKTWKAEYHSQCFTSCTFCNS